jgi:CBS domain-containing protein
MAMNVADVMTRGVISLAPDDSMRKAAQLMLRYDMSGIPVVDRGKLVGIVTEGDFLRRTETGTERQRRRWIEILVGPGRLAEEYAHAHGRTIDEVMTREVVTVAEDTSLEEAVRLMELHHVKRLPVVKGDAVVGIITRANLVRAFIMALPKIPASPVSDAAIREKLVAELDKQPWAPRGSFDAVVENGVVDLQGIIRDERQCVALRIAAENIPGVKQVRDHLLELDLSAVE